MKSLQTTTGFGLAAAWFALVLGVTARADEAAKIDFVSQVQPILAEHCYACHGPDKQESGLRLDKRDAALAGGDSGPVLVAGDSKTSELVRRITSADDDRMPPADPGRKALTPQEIATVTAWIDQGSAWPEGRGGSAHWSFQPIGKVEPPAVQESEWVRNPIDRFVLARLEAKGTRPSSEADRVTLVKRLHYDLLGLPPTPEEVDAFVADTASDAYERLVDRLLDSPHFGERWGRHWLDMARYADSDGYEKDNSRPDAWRFRNWVIDAINADMPLDRFTIEQLAGDLLEGATPDDRLATAFNRQTLTNTEGGTDQEEWRVAAIFDRVATTGSVWLGLTIGCAQCHSHKYDPISHEEYYQLFAFFNNGDEAESEVPLVGEALATYTRERAEAETKLAELRPQLEAKRAELAAKLPQWEAGLHSASGTPLAFHPVELVGIESNAGSEFKQLSDGSYLAAGKNPDVDKVTITARSELKDITGFRIEALAHDSLGGRGPGRTEHGNFVLSEFRAFAAESATIEKKHRLALASAAADYAQDGFAPQNTIDNKEKTGWAVGQEFGRDHWIVFTLKKPLQGGATPFLRFVLSQNHGTQHTLGRFRVMATTGHDPTLEIPKAIRDILAIDAAQRSVEQAKSLVDYFIGRDKGAKDLTDQVAAFEKKLQARPVMNVRTIAQRTEKPRTTHVLHRGDFLQPAAEVRPGTLTVLPPLVPRGAVGDRLDLARWLVDTDNPLTPRVFANHLWTILFGRGLVRTQGDFGVRGEPPTHPELLDWLAGEMIRRNWSRKDMIRLVISSATYRQASQTRQELVETDPLNDLFYRQNRWRVEAEIVRDLALAVGGLLSEKIGGPSVFPPLPPGIAELSYAGNFKWNESTGEDRYRRGMYTYFKRTAPHPNLTTFDCPDSNTTTLVRRTSNTPLQALQTLNNGAFVEAAQSMAKRLLEGPPSDDQTRLALALRRCVARQPTAEDLSAFGELLAVSRQWYREHASEAKEMVGGYQPAGVATQEAAAWVATTRMILNLDEFLTRE